MNKGKKPDVWTVTGDKKLVGNWPFNPKGTSIVYPLKNMDVVIATLKFAIMVGPDSGITFEVDERTNSVIIRAPSETRYEWAQIFHLLKVMEEGGR